jgi:hypothetical protein
MLAPQNAAFEASIECCAAPASLIPPVAPKTIPQDPTTTVMAIVLIIALRIAITWLCFSPIPVTATRSG